MQAAMIVVETPLQVRLAAGLVACGLCFLFAAPAHAYLAFVSNERGDTVSVVDTTSMETIKTIPTGQRPRGIGAPGTANSSMSRSATTTPSKSSTRRPWPWSASCRPAPIPNNSH